MSGYEETARGGGTSGGEPSSLGNSRDVLIGGCDGRWRGRRSRRWWWEGGKRGNVSPAKPCIHTSIHHSCHGGGGVHSGVRTAFDPTLGFPSLLQNKYSLHSLVLMFSANLWLQNALCTSPSSDPVVLVLEGTPVDTCPPLPAPCGDSSVFETSLLHRPLLHKHPKRTGGSRPPPRAGFQTSPFSIPGRHCGFV